MTHIEVFEKEFQSWKEPISESLKKNGILWGDFHNSINTQIRNKPKLLDANRESFLGAIFAAAGFGLPPDVNLSYFLIDRKGHVRLEIGYQGWIELVTRNPKVDQIYAELWYEEDDFEWSKGLKPNLIHKPAPRTSKLNRAGAYAVCVFKGGEIPQFTVLYKQEIDVIKKNALDRDPYGVWANDSLDTFGWMWRKTAILQLVKTLPKIGLTHAIEHDNTGGHVVLNKAGKPILVNDDGFEIKRKREARAKDIVNNYKSLFD